MHFIRLVVCTPGDMYRRRFCCLLLPCGVTKSHEFILVVVVVVFVVVVVVAIDYF